MTDRAQTPDPAPPKLSAPQDGEPRPWNWTGQSTVGTTSLADSVAEFVAYFNSRYAWTVENSIPPCWYLHGALVEEITTLMWSRWSAFESPKATPEAAQTWHTYYLPGFLVRLGTWVGRQALGECRAGNHEPSRLVLVGPVTTIRART